MMNLLRRLFDQPDHAFEQLDGPDRVPLAAACLMLEAARLDDNVTSAEMAAIRRQLSSHFKLDGAELQSLLAAAETVSQGAAQWYAFTSRLKDALGYDERVAIIEMLWHVVYADGALHHLEQSLMRRVGGLLYVSDRDRAEAGIRVRAALGLSE